MSGVVETSSVPESQVLQAAPTHHSRQLLQQGGKGRRVEGSVMTERRKEESQVCAQKQVTGGEYQLLSTAASKRQKRCRQGCQVLK